MDKIKFSKDEKRVLLALAKGEYPNQVPEQDYGIMNLLEVYNLVSTTKVIGDRMIAPHLTDRGKAYLTANPKLKNPSILDDKKYVINTIISVAALTVAIIALFN